MSHKTASKHKKNSPPALNGGESFPTSALTVPKQIELRAYELYELRSHEDGFAGDDWLKAEQEVLCSARSVATPPKPSGNRKNHIDLSRCAVAQCSGRWRKMGEGKLFLFHFKERLAAARLTKMVWLCENCFESWAVTLDLEGRVVLSPLQRMAS